MLRLALLTTDGRDLTGSYDLDQPLFGSAPEALLQGFAQMPDAIEVDVIACLRKPTHSPKQLAPNIRFHTLRVPKVGWMRTGYQGCIRAVRAKLRELKPDIVHGQGTERECAITAVFSGFPNLVTVHGNMRLIAEVNRERPFTYNWFNAYLEGWTLPRTDGIVCITHYTENAVHDLARRTWVLPNAVDQNFFLVQPAPVSPPVVLCVGFICERKNQNRFIRALDELATRREFRVRFLGHVPSDEYGTEFRRLLATRPWCEEGGMVGRDPLRDEFSRAAVLALPSLEDNCPMAVLEAMAAGVPVVAAKVGGVPDLITDGQTGLLCDPFDGASMAGAVEKLLDSPKKAGAMAAAARAEAHARFAPPVVARRHVEIYRELLQSRS